MGLPMGYQRLKTRAKSKNKELESDIDMILYFMKVFNNSYELLLSYTKSNNKLSAKLEIEKKLKLLKDWK